MNGAEGDIPALWQDFPVGLTVGYDLLSGTVGTVFKDAEVFCETGGNSGGNGPGRWNFTRSAGSTECVSVIIHLTRDKKFQQRKQGVLLHQLIPGDTGFRKISACHGRIAAIQLREDVGIPCGQWISTDIAPAQAIVNAGVKIQIHRGRLMEHDDSLRGGQAVFF